MEPAIGYPLEGSTMPSPFPGMDPYLESHWGDVHTKLVTYSGDQLQPQLRSRAVAGRLGWPTRSHCAQWHHQVVATEFLVLAGGSNSVVGRCPVVAGADVRSLRNRATYRGAQALEHSSHLPAE
ncbi:MAG: DUF4058 family protein [Gemmataceae bacterium]|nr:DUF4058 family protein [Gemmataceae bacterium]